MPIDSLDPKPALVVIDLQEGLRAVPGQPHSVADVFSRNAELAAAFRDRGFPVVLVNAAAQPPGRTERNKASGPPAPLQPAAYALVPELNAQPSDILVTKERWGAFYDSPLHKTLQDLGVTQVVVTGIATSIGVESTARSAYEQGYNVVTVTDAMTDGNPAAHENSTGYIFPRLGETTTTSELLEKLKG